MSKQTEALKLALEALEVLGWQPTEEAMDYRDNAIDAIRNALAEQPEQKQPVQVSPLEFVTMTLEKEHLVGQPIIWAQWPSKADK